MEITIRQASIEDVPVMHELVGELALFHDALEDFEATKATFRKDFEEGFFNALVAVIDGKVVGMTLYCFIFSTFKGRTIYLEDFVINRNYRRLGIGQKLWDALVDKGRERGCVLLKWQIHDENETAMAFYRAQNAIIERDWMNGKLYL